MAKTRYIIAMLAMDQNCFVSFAQDNFAHLAENYLLGEHAKAHVTLVQFHGEEHDYKAAVAYLNTVSDNPQPRLTGLQFGQDNSAADILWANMTVARDAKLVAVHTGLVDFLQLRNITVLNDAKELYYPHVTFARIKTAKIEAQKPNIPSVAFSLAIGIADEYGQFIEVKHVFNPELVAQTAIPPDFSRPRFNSA